MNSVEQSYDEVPYHHKEMAGLPNRYYDLTTEQRFFVDSFFEGCYNILTDEAEVKEEVENLKDLVREVEQSTAHIYKTIRSTFPE